MANGVIPARREHLRAEEEAAAIDRAMEAFARRDDYPLYVVTAGLAEGGDMAGCLVGFVTQCSITPPRFLVCISKLNRTFFVAERSRGIGLHLLGREQRQLASLFGEETSDTFPKFEHCDWREGVTGTPVLTHCAAWLEGLIMDRFDVGDHQALLVRPLSGGDGDRPGLLTLRQAPDLHAGHPARP